MMKNRKAGMFAAGMILAMLIFMSTAWFAFSTTNKKINAEFDVFPDLKNFYDNQDRFVLYSTESSKFAASQAFYEIAKDSAIDKNKDSCQVYNNIIIWSGSCKPETSFVETKFMESFNAGFNGLIQKFPNPDFKITYSNALNGNNIDSTAQAIKQESKEKGSFAAYTFTFSFEPTIHLDLEKKNLHDFILIYERATEAKNKCGQDIPCLKNTFNMENWIFDVEKSSNYMIFRLRTKTSYFYNDGAEKFSPIELNFALAS